MKRRNALRYLALSVAGTVSLPIWAQGWSEKTLPVTGVDVTPDKIAMLTEMVETIIPITDTPGAKAIGVQQFILAMVADCYPKKAQDAFLNGFELLDNFAKNKFTLTFLKCSPTQRTEILSMLDMAHKTNLDALTEFMAKIKNLTIQGYLNSEYVMTNLLKYEMVPSRFNGSLMVKK